MQEINDSVLPEVANRDMDVNTVLPSVQEQLFNRPWKNDGYAAVPDLPTSTPAEESTADKLFYDQTPVDKINPLSYESTHILRKEIPDYAVNRYDYFYPGRTDQEDIAARAQSTTERVGRAFYNTIPRLTHTLTESIISPLAGTGYMLFGNEDQGFMENPWNKWMETWGEGKSIYETNERKNADWWTPKYWWSANSLNSVLGAAADLTAFYLTGRFVAGPLVGAIGARGAGYLGAQYDNAVQNIAKLASVLPEGQEGKIAVQELTTAIEDIAARGGTQASKAQELTNLLEKASKRYSSGMSNLSKFQQGAASVVTNLGMSQSTSYSTYNQMKESLIQEIKDTGREPSAEELQKIEETAGDAAITSGMVMGIMGAATLHGILKSSIAKRNATDFVRNEINNITRNEAGEYVVASELNKATTIGGKVWNTAKSVGKKIGERVDPWTGVGFMEFGIAPAAVEDYYEKKYHDPNNEGEIAPEYIGDAIIGNVKNMASKEGISSFFTGMIAGSLGAGGKFWNREGRRIKRENTTEFINALNKSYQNGELKSFVSSANRGLKLHNDLIDAVREGDKAKELDIKQQSWENYIYPRIKYGKKQFIDADLDGYRKVAMTDEGIRQLQQDGIIEQGDNLIDLRQKFNSHLDHLQGYTNRAQSYFDALSLKYGGVTGKNGKPLYSDGQLERLMLISGGLDDANRRTEELKDEVLNSELSKSPSFIKRLAQITDVLDGITSTEPGLNNSTLDILT